MTEEHESYEVGGAQATLEPEPGKRGRRRKLLPVRVVEDIGVSLLVEWSEPSGLLKRGYVPQECVVNDAAELSDLEAAAPYGVPWEQVLNVSDFTALRVAVELRRSGFWTRAQVEKDPGHAMRAVLRALPLNVSVLRRAAKQYDEGG